MRRVPAGLALLYALVSAPLGAQALWDAPSLVGPHAPSGLSVLLVSAAPRDNLGAFAHWAREQGDLGLGYRLGIAQDGDEGVAAFGGVDVSGLIANSVEDADIQVSWWSGFGVGVGHAFVASIPVGLVVGWRGLGDGSGFSPYAGGHMVLDLSSEEGTRARLGGVVDFGLDLELESGWVVRFGGAVGDRTALAIGLRVPGAGAE